MDCKKFYFWLKNILGVCFWLLLVNYWFFKIDFLYGFFEKIIFFTKNNCFYLLIGIYLIFIFTTIIKKTNILNKLIGLTLFILYIIFYPFLKLLNIVFNFIMNLYVFDSVLIKNLLHFIFFLPLFLLLYSAIVTFDNHYILSASIFGLIACVFFYQLYLLYWFNDSNLFIKFPAMILNNYSKDRISQHYIIKSHFMMLIKFLLNRRLWFFMFVIIFVFALFLNTITFSFIYFGLSRIDKSCFLGMGKINLLNHFYFAVSNFSTIKIANITPTTQFAKISVLLQIFSAIFLFSIIVISFSFTSSEDSEVERKKLIEKANSELTNIKGSLNLAKDAKDIDLLKFILKKSKS
jgi:hypothetical protein